jgi:hypothetical protein
VIVLDLPANAECDASGCTRSAPVKITLLATGGFGFAPAGDRPVLKQWQFGTSNPLGPIVARCPEHHLTVQAAPTGPRLITSEH